MESPSSQVTIRAARPPDSGALARVQVDGFRSAYRSLLPKAYLDHFTTAEQAQEWLELIRSLEGQVLLVAESWNGAILGYALGEVVDCYDSYSCEITSLQVLPGYQRRGIGRRLMAAVALGLKNLGHASAFLWTLEKIQARAIYEKWGGVLFDRKPWSNNAHFQVTIFEVAYGWADIDTLVDLHASADRR